MAGKGGKQHTKGTTKELELVHSKMNLWSFKYKDGGKLPEVLKGDWNNKAQALTVRDSYLNNRNIAQNASRKVSKAV